MSIFSQLDDDDGFNMNPGLGGSAGGGNLLNLFGMNSQMDASKGQGSLTYTAPKQPSKQGQQQSANTGKSQESGPATAGGTAAAPVFAVAVHAYRFKNGQNEKVGRVGAAVIKNPAKKDFKILLYVSKQQPVAAARIHPAFSFTIQANNCGGFYDEQQQYWNIIFDNEGQLKDFSKHVSLSKFFSSPACDQLVTLDLSARSKQQQLAQVGVGDNAEVEYTGWLVHTHTCSTGAVFDTNVGKDKMFRFKIGQGKVIKGWDQGMLGMEKGLHRFLVIPAHMAYGERGMGTLIPPQSILAFEVQLIRMKQSKENAAAGGRSRAASDASHGSANQQHQQHAEEQQPDEAQQAQKPAAASAVQQQPRLQQQQQQSTVAGDGSMSMGNGDVMSRIANVGMPMFPMMPTTTTNTTSSTSPMPIPAPVPHQQEPIKPQASFMSAASSYAPVTANQQPPAVVSTYYQNHLPHQGVMSAGADPQHGMIPLILNESKQHNQELRLVQHKLDHISLLMHEMKKEARESSSNHTGVGGGGGVPPGLHKILQENQQLGKRVSEMTGEIEQHKDTIKQLLNKSGAGASGMGGDDHGLTAKFEVENLQLKQQLELSKSALEGAEAKVAAFKELRQSMKELYTNEQQRAEKNGLKMKEMEKELSEIRSRDDSMSSNQQQQLQALENENLELKATMRKQEAEWKDERAHLQQDLEELRVVHEEAGNVCRQAEAKMNSLKNRVNQLEGAIAKYQNDDIRNQNLKDKLSEARALYESEKAELEESRELVAAYKDRHELLRNRAGEMKQRYTEEITRLQSVVKKQSSGGGAASKDFPTEVKKVMNSVFQSIRSEVGLEERYTGKQLLDIALRVIKKSTLDVIEQQQHNSASSSALEESDSGSSGLHRQQNPAESSQKQRVSFSPSTVPINSSGAAEKITTDEEEESTAASVDASTDDDAARAQSEEQQSAVDSKEEDEEAETTEATATEDEVESIVEGGAGKVPTPASGENITQGEAKLLDLDDNDGGDSDKAQPPPLPSTNDDDDSTSEDLLG